MFAQLFPSLPQFRGRQVATLHNQRDFLFFRRHRYAFTSPTSAKLQEIGPRFTLKLRWMRKGLPAVRAGDGRMPSGGDAGEEEFAIDDDEEVEAQEKMDEEEAAAEMGQGPAKNQNITPSGQAIPALDEEQEYEWKWKVSSALGNMMLTCSQKWKSRVGPSSYRLCICLYSLHLRFSSMHHSVPSLQILPHLDEVPWWSVIFNNAVDSFCSVLRLYCPGQRQRRRQPLTSRPNRPSFILNTQNGGEQ